MKVTQGRTFIVHGFDSNGTMEHPAIVTRTWSDRHLEEGAIAVNLTVMPDCAVPRVCSSVLMFASRDEAIAHRVENPHALVAFWPDRV